MAKLTIAQEVCKGCGLCADVCTKKLLVLSGEINSRGYHPIAMTEQEKCIGCAFCARMPSSRWRSNARLILITGGSQHGSENAHEGQ